MKHFVLLADNIDVILHKNHIIRKLKFSFHRDFFRIAMKQLERDDALTEIQILKEKLEKAQYSMNKAHEERENTTKEFEKMLEKYDR